MADVIKEFLVGLGFKIDDNSYKKFVGSVASATTRTAEMGATVTAAATAIGVHVERVTREFEHYAYVAQRTGTQAVSPWIFGAKQIGISADAAVGSIEDLAAVMRTQPGVQGVLSSFGVGPGDAKKQLIDFTTALKSRFGEAQYFVAQRYAAMAGIDERTFRQLWTNLDRVKREDADSNRRWGQAGMKQSELNATFLEYARLLNLTGDNVAILGARIATDFLPYAKGMTTWVNDMIGKFNKFNAEKGGAPGMVGAVLGTGIAGTALAKIAAMLGIPGAGTASAIASGAWRFALNPATLAVGAGIAGGIYSKRSAPGETVLPSNASRAQEGAAWLLATVFGEKITRSGVPDNRPGGTTWLNPLSLVLTALSSSTDRLVDALSAGKLLPQWLSSGTAPINVPVAGRLPSSKKVWGDREAEDAGLYDRPLTTRVPDRPTVGEKAAPVTISTSIHLSGVTRAEDAAKMILSEQEGLYSRMLRNGIPKVQ